MKLARVLPFAFLGIGVIVISLGAREITRAMGSADWPTAQGKVVTSSIESHRRTGSKGNSVTYHARVLYEFTVGGRPVNGSRIAYGDYGSGNRSHAQDVVNRYPQGKGVTVYHMPGKPEECLLEPGAKVQAWILPFVGAIFASVGGVIAWSARTSRKKEEPAGTRNAACTILKNFGKLDETGSGESFMKTEARLALRGGKRILQVTMTYATGPEERTQTFVWRLDGNQLKEVVDDLERVIRMVERGEGDRVRGRWIERLMARFQNVRFLADLGPVSFHDGQDKVNGLAGRAFGYTYFLYEVGQGGSSSIQPFPLSSLRAIVKVLRQF